jgi:FkbM family methyltransferase
VTGLTRNRVPLTLFHPASGAGWTTLWTRADSTDETVLEEIFEADVYRLRSLDLSTRTTEDENLGTAYFPLTVIDLGANIGVFAATCLQMGVARVVAVEPEPNNVELLRKNLQPWVAQHQVTILEAAVGPTNGKTVIVGDAGTAHTADGDGGFVVDQITLADVLSYTDGPVAMLKCDVEGAEFSIVEACPSEVLARVERVHMEWHGPSEAPHLGPDDGRYGRLMTKLARTHAVSVFGDPDKGGMAYWHRYDL